MMSRKWKTYWEIAKRLNVAVKGAQISLYAAQAAFFVFFSAIPLCVLLISLFHMFMPALNEKLALAIVRYCTEAGFGAGISAVRSFLDTSAGVASASLIAVFWSATRGVRAIGEGISGIYGSRFGQKNWILRSAYSLLYTVILILSILTALAVLAFGSYLLVFLTNLLPQGKWLWKLLFGWRFPIVALLLVFFFALFYRLLGSKGMSFRAHLPGAVFSAGGWIVFSILFSLYLRVFSQWQNLYGGLSLLLILMLWIYGCMYMMMMGALINVYLNRKARIVK